MMLIEPIRFPLHWLHRLLKIRTLCCSGDLGEVHAGHHPLWGSVYCREISYSHTVSYRIARYPISRVANITVLLPQVWYMYLRTAHSSPTGRNWMVPPIVSIPPGELPFLSAPHLQRAHCGIHVDICGALQRVLGAFELTVLPPQARELG